MVAISQLGTRFSQRIRRFNINRQVMRLASQLNRSAHPDPQTRPVVFFNASTRLVGLSLNAAFSLLSSWALRLQGIPVVHFVCQAGMSHCVLGTDRENPSSPPPCGACISQSRWLYFEAMTIPFTYQPAPQLESLLRSQSLEQLMEYEFDSSDGATQNTSLSLLTPIPLGQLVLPSVRWVLRRHQLQDDEPTRFLFREYILSASWIAQEFSACLDRSNPQAIVLFNGQLYPEATARWVANQSGIRAITHEVGLQPFSAFFTPGDATAYPLEIPGDFELDNDQNDRLDSYLSQRFKGQFSMAGICFWPEMQALEPEFVQRFSNYTQVVPIFTNVIFDTSQPHSNVIFPHMFAWLQLLLEEIRKHPETLFVLRAHPDEVRPGKSSQESVSQWVARQRADTLPNLIFVSAAQRISSYELIQRSKFVLIYNSTIGLEASILGKPVLCAGRARFTQLPTVFFPASLEEYRQRLEAFLTADQISMPTEFTRNARRFLYYQLYYSSLPFGDFIEPEIMPGFVQLRKFPISKLTPQDSPTVRVIVDGILKGQPFLLNDQDERNH